MKNGRILILGGGTFQPISNHLSLSAPSFGTTARYLHSKIKNSELYLTKMADSTSNLVTNEDVESFIMEQINDEHVIGIILSVAFCDFKYQNGDFHGERMKTDLGPINLTFEPTEKVINKIRLKRPDIFLVGFKTTTNKTTDEQFISALRMCKNSKSNLVLANDTVTRNNIIITPEESFYGDTKNRTEILDELVEIFSNRIIGTYNYSELIPSSNTPISALSQTFNDVVKYLVDNGGFIENNGNGFTPGHFCQKVSDKSFVSSQRKVNHNNVFEVGMSLVRVVDDKFYVYGERKASVGARSQWMMLNNNDDFDCIIHTHNPLKEGSEIPVARQKPFQCGSLECGINTLTHLKRFGDIKAVYLEKHGANIVFKSTSRSEDVINSIKENIELGIKVK
jgi:hypothetical protein